jgi:hypothetical protein
LLQNKDTPLHFASRWGKAAAIEVCTHIHIPTYTFAVFVDVSTSDSRSTSDDNAGSYAFIQQQYTVLKPSKPQVTGVILSITVMIAQTLMALPLLLHHNS